MLVKISFTNLCKERTATVNFDAVPLFSVSPGGIRDYYFDTDPALIAGKILSVDVVQDSTNYQNDTNVILNALATLVNDTSAHIANESVSAAVAPGIALITFPALPSLNGFIDIQIDSEDVESAKFPANENFPYELPLVTGGGGVGIESVQAENGLNVDVTDPLNPVVKLGGVFTQGETVVGNDSTLNYLKFTHGVTDETAVIIGVVGSSTQRASIKAFENLSIERVQFSLETRNDAYTEGSFIYGTNNFSIGGFPSISVGNYKGNSYAQFDLDSDDAIVKRGKFYMALEGDGKPWYMEMVGGNFSQNHFIIGTDEERFKIQPLISSFMFGGSAKFTIESAQTKLLNAVTVNDPVAFVSIAVDGTLQRSTLANIPAGTPVQIIGYDGSNKVTKIPFANLVTANNGLSEDTQNNIQLGGTLVKNTDINMGSFLLSLSGLGNLLRIGNGGCIEMFVSANSAIPISIVSDNGANELCALFVGNKTSANSVVSNTSFRRTTTGTPANGIGVAIDFEVESSAATITSCRLKSIVTDVSADKTEFVITVRNGVSQNDIISMKGDGIIRYNQGLQDFADDTAAAAGGIPVNGLYRTGSAVKIRVV